MKKLNLGCGENWKEYPDYEGLDIINYGQKYVESAFSFLDVQDSKIYDEVMANHFLEHFNQDELGEIFTGIHKILKPSGTFKFVVPHMKKDRAYILSHKTFWNETVIRWLEEEEAEKTYGFGKWKILEIVTNSRGDIHGLIRKI